MNIIDVTERFNDNALTHRRRMKRLWHWTGSNTAKSAIDWLDQRLDGKGSVGYNFIGDRNGDIYMLADPFKSFMNSSGLGTYYDRESIAYSFVMLNEAHEVTAAQIKAAREWIEWTDKNFHITADVHHAQINAHKRDFPRELWNKLKIDLGIEGRYYD